MSRLGAQLAYIYERHLLASANTNITSGVQRLKLI